MVSMGSIFFPLIVAIFIPPANFVCGGVYCFHIVRACVCVCVRPCVRASVRNVLFFASVCACVRPSVTFFFNNLKSHSWIFIKPCKHVHICKSK